jgi:hybrid cluster-associated redox disulfide protein
MRQKDLDDPDLTLDTIMSVWPQTVSVFMRHKMLCVGCMANPFHTVIDACVIYHLDERRFRLELHQAVGS